MERIKLFYSSKIEEPWCDLKKIFSLLDKLKGAKISIEIIDIAEMTEGERHRIYTKEVVYPSVLNRYRIGHIFGTRQKSGSYFGKKQPCLLFYGIDAERELPLRPTPGASLGLRWRCIKV